MINTCWDMCALMRTRGKVIACITIGNENRLLSGVLRSGEELLSETELGHEFSTGDIPLL